MMFTLNMHRKKKRQDFAPCLTLQRYNTYCNFTDGQEWLYDEGEDATKNQYIAKLEELLSIGGPVRQRFLDAQEKARQEQIRIQQEREAEEKRLREEAEAAKKAQEEANKAATASEEMLVDGPTAPETERPSDPASETTAAKTEEGVEMRDTPTPPH